MCGIGGAISTQIDSQGSRPVSPLLPLIVQDQNRRGPDHSAILQIESNFLSIGFAHNRLAILDLTAESNQPFVDQATGTHLVFNGEIYNYLELRRELQSLGVQFHTHSDTETLLKAYVHWGVKAFSRFNGMFAFAIWDPRSQELLLVRDRFGVKPLYYVQNKNEFAFASDTKALADYFKLPVNWEYVARTLAYDLADDGAGIAPFEGMAAVSPGTYLQLRQGQLRVHKFYDIRERVAAEQDRQKSLSESQLIYELDQRLRSAVELRLRADVPVTVSLSGGLDSALLAAYIRDVKPHPVDVFTYGNLADPLSEASAAKQTADLLEFRLHCAEIRPDNLGAVFERTLEHQGAPFSHPSVMAQNEVFAQMRQHGFKVSIGGQGADEIFMGYRKYQFFYLKDLWRHKRWSRLPAASYGLLQLLAAQSSSVKDFASQVRRYILARPQTLSTQSVYQPLRIGFSSDQNLLDRQLIDMDYASLATLLRYEDRNSMGHSIESRMPFLDYWVVEFGLALHPHYKIRNGYGKWILRQIAERRLPYAIVNNRNKVAFSMNTQVCNSNEIKKALSNQNGHGPSLVKESDRQNLESLRQSVLSSESPHIASLVAAHWLKRA